MYKLTKNSNGEVNGVFNSETNTAIPFDPDNTDYQAFLLWCEQGNTPTPAEVTE